MAYPGYDVEANLRVKAAGDRLVDLLAELSALDGMDGRTFARDACKAAFGVELDGSGPNKLSDEQTRALIPLAEACLATMVVVATVLDQRKR